MTAPRAGLTPRQQQAFNAIVDYFAAHGYAPSYRELAKRLNLRGVGGIKRLADSLVERGYITRIPGRAHSIAIVGTEATQSYELPATTEAALAAFCRLNRESPRNVVADSVALYLDQHGVGVSDEQVRKTLPMATFPLEPL